MKLKSNLLRSVTAGTKRLRYLAAGVLFACLLTISLPVTDTGVSAQGTFPDPNLNCPKAECGEVSPFIPMQSTEAVTWDSCGKRVRRIPKSFITPGSPNSRPTTWLIPL